MAGGAGGGEGGDADRSASYRQRRAQFEASDNSYYVIVDGDGTEAGAGSSTTTAGADDTLDFGVRAVTAGGLLTVEVALHNLSPAPVEFGPGGLLVTAEVTLDGRPWRVVEISDPGLVRLGADVAVTRETTTPLAGAGHYAVTASAETLRS